MIKFRTIALSSLIIAGLTLTGCGSDDSPDNTDTVETGVGYYLDNAVSGVNYTCGSQSGITDSDGKFTFENGKDCTFELAGISLRTVPSTDLIDGKDIVENNVTVAMFLQSLDYDGNTSNGIQIEANVIEALRTTLENLKDGSIVDIEDITEVTANIDVVLAGVKEDINSTDFKAEVVTAEEVTAHLYNTQTAVTINLLSGKTLYYVNYEDSSLILGKAIIDDNVSTMVTSTLRGTGNYDGSDTIHIAGDRLVWNDDNSFSEIEYNNEEYLSFYDYTSDGSFQSLTRVYFSQTDAENYYDSLTPDVPTVESTSLTPPTDNKFTAEWLNGKTLYNSYLEDGAWEIAVFSFTSDTLSGYSLSNPDDKMDTIPYTITQEGYIEFKPTYRDDNVSEYIGIRSSTDTYMSLGWTDYKDNIMDTTTGEIEYFSFDLATAQSLENL